VRRKEAVRDVLHHVTLLGLGGFSIQTQTHTHTGTGTHTHSHTHTHTHTHTHDLDHDAMAEELRYRSIVASCHRFLHGLGRFG
jgi:hypothetical protein